MAICSLLLSVLLIAQPTVKTPVRLPDLSKRRIEIPQDVLRRSRDYAWHEEHQRLYVVEGQSESWRVGAWDAAGYLRQTWELPPGAKPATGVYARGWAVHVGVWREGQALRFQELELKANGLVETCAGRAEWLEFVRWLDQADPARARRLRDGMASLLMEPPGGPHQFPQRKLAEYPILVGAYRYPFWPEDADWCLANYASDYDLRNHGFAQTGITILLAGRVPAPGQPKRLSAEANSLKVLTSSDVLEVRRVRVIDDFVLAECWPLNDRDGKMEEPLVVAFRFGASNLTPVEARRERLARLLMRIGPGHPPRGARSSGRAVPGQGRTAAASSATGSRACHVSHTGAKRGQPVKIEPARATLLGEHIERRIIHRKPSTRHRKPGRGSC